MLGDDAFTRNEMDELICCIMNVLRDHRPIQLVSTWQKGVSSRKILSSALKALLQERLHIVHRVETILEFASSKVHQ
jgi:hypothetical protein